MDDIQKLKIAIREEDVPFFSDEELQYYLDKNKTLTGAIYECLCIKAEDTTLSISGLSTANSSLYFRRLANMYRPNNSGTLRM